MYSLNVTISANQFAPAPVTHTNPAMAVNASAAVSTMVKIPSVLVPSVVEIAHQQSPFSSLSSIGPSSIKLVSSIHSRKRVIISCAEGTKSASGGRPKSGVSVYKPRSYEVLVYSLQDRKTRVEIDFPPLPTDISSYKGSSDEYSDANVQLALAVVRKLQQKQETRACIVFPDKPERRRATDLFKAALDSIDGITIGSLDDVPSGAVTSFFKSIRDNWILILQMKMKNWNISNDHHILYELDEQIHQKHEYQHRKKIKVVKLYSHRDRRVMVIKSCHFADFVPQNEQQI